MDSDAFNAALSFITNPTTRLKSVLWNKAHATDRAEFDSIIDSVRSLFEKYTRILWETSPGIPRAALLHQLIDLALEEAKSLAITCRSGCCGCCHFAVEITRDEAALLMELAATGVDIDLDKLERQADRELGSPEWQVHWSEESRCVFLGADSRCRIYEHRPAACRKLLVTTPAALCTSANAEVQPVNALAAEIIVSAAMSLEDHAQGTLPSMLAQCIRETGRAESTEFTEFTESADPTPRNLSPGK
jgi:Fe-S-cluster containining protein